MRALGLALVLFSVSPALAQPPGCESLPVLERYDQLAPGAHFRLTLEYDASSPSWVPAPGLEHTLHHADTFDFGGFAFPTARDPLVPPIRGRSVSAPASITVEVTSLERVLREYDDSIHTWFFVHRVRVERVCS